MQRRSQILLPPDDIAKLWRERINRRIWCSNQYARQLMDIGLTPPLTGNVLLNPWAEFNISGQFLCETFGLIAPGLPQTASKIGLHYTRVAIDGEPAQTTQFFDTMIAMAFFTSDMEALLDAGLTALLYGGGNFVQTLEIAFNMGWDCDNSAATAGTIVGVTKGYRWMLAQGWPIVDRYHNTTRQGMPQDETITSFADRLIELAEQVILEAGGQSLRHEGRQVYRIPLESPACVATLPDRTTLAQTLRTEFGPTLQDRLMAPDPSLRAGAAYIAICLDLQGELEREAPDAWRTAVDDLRRFDQVAQALFHHSPSPRRMPSEPRCAVPESMRHRQNANFGDNETSKSSKHTPLHQRKLSSRAHTGRTGSFTL